MKLIKDMILKVTDGITGALFIVLFFVIPLSAKEVMDSERVRELAVSNCEDIKISDKKSRIAKSSSDFYFTNYLPKLSFKGGLLYRGESTSLKTDEGYLPTFKKDPATGKYVPNVMIDKNGNPVVDKNGNVVFEDYAYLPSTEKEIIPDFAYNAGVSLEQPVYTGGKITAAYNIARQYEESALFNKSYVRENIICEADRAYWKLVSLNEKRNVINRYLDLLRNVSASVEDAYSAEMSNKNDLLKAKVRLNSVTLDSIKLANGIALAKLNLQRITGIYDKIVVADSAIAIEKVSFVKPEDVVNSRADYKMLKNNIDIADYNIALAGAEYLPQAGMIASYSYTDFELDNSDKGDFSFTIGATLNFPIYHFNESIYKKDEMRLKKEIEEENLSKSKKLMLLEINRAIFNVKNSLKQIEFADFALSQAEENMSSAEDNFHTGLESITNLLEAQAEWQSANSNLIEAKSDFKIYLSEYKKATGTLIE